MSQRHTRIGLLLATTSVAALLAAAQAPARAQCTPPQNNVTGPSGPVTNSGAASCINVFDATVTGNVTNTNTGVISGTAAGISIDNSTITGRVANQGSITSSSHGIIVFNNSTVLGGIVNSGNITAGISGGPAVVVIGVNGVSTFAGGITNSGSLASPSGNGINVDTVSSFADGITNTGSISTAGRPGINLFAVSLFSGGIVNDNTDGSTAGAITASTGISLFAVSTFGGGITNKGTVNATTTGIKVNGVDTFTGGIVNNGTIATPTFAGISVGTVSTFAGGITNNGTITANILGIDVSTISAFSGGITNTGTITTNFIGISISSVSTFTGDIVNNGGTISASRTGISVCSCVDTFAGSIINTGTINAGSAGIFVEVATFTGGITNTGTITTTSPFGFTPGGIIVSGTASFAGNIVNTGTITSAAAGIGVTGVLVFAGGITNAGTIDARGGIIVAGVATFGGGIVNSKSIVNASTGIFVSGVQSFAGGINNSGSIAANFTGITVSGVQTFAGGITNSGSISANFTGIGVTSVETFGGGITNSGTITAAFGISLGGCGCGPIDTFAGGITNRGSIIAGTTGIFVAANVSTFLGGITNTGTITAGTAGIMLEPGGISVFNSGTISVAGATAIQFGGSGNTLILGPGSAITGAVLGTGNDAFQLGGPSGAGTFDVSTIGVQYQGFSTFAKVDNATWMLTGSNSAALPWTVSQGTLNVATGTSLANSSFTVQGGVLSVNGTVGAVTLSGGTLGGNGTTGSVIINGGTLSPGNSIGTITINGSLTMSAAAAYLVEVSPTSADRVNVTGKASLAGPVQLQFGPGTYAAHSYTILSAAGGLGGTTFGSLVNALPNFTASLSYTTTDVLLNLTAALGNGTSLNRNQQSVANAINTSLNAGGAPPPQFGTVFGLTGDALRNALTQLSGESATGMQQSSFLSSDLFLKAMLDPFVEGRGGSFGASPNTAMAGYAPQQPVNRDAASAFAAFLKAPPKTATLEERWGVWGATYGGYNRTDGDPVVVGSHDLTARTGGFAAGADYRYAPGSVLGAAVAIGTNNWGLSSGLGKGNSDVAQVGGYASTRWSNMYVSAAFAGAFYNATTDRFVSVAGLDHLRGDFDAHSFSARAEAGRRFGTMMLGVTPYAAVQLQSVSMPTYAEAAVSGSNAFALSYRADTVTDTRTELGGWADTRYAFESGNSVLLRGRAAWVHDFHPDRRASAIFQTLPGAAFTVDGARAAEDSALLSGAAELRLTNGVTLIGRFDGEFAGGSQTYAGTGTIRYAW